MSRKGPGQCADSLRADVRRSLFLLESLDRNAVVLDVYGHAWQSGGLYWYRAFGDDSQVTAWELCQRGPFKRMEVAG